VMQKESDALAASLFKVRNFPDPSIKFPVRSKKWSAPLEMDRRLSRD